MSLRSGRLGAIFLLVGVVCHLGAGVAPAREWQDGELGFLRYPMGGRGVGLRYRTYLPRDYDASQSYPLVLYLHPNGQQGADGNRHVNFFPTSLISRTYEQNPAILLAPQARVGTSWSTALTRRLTQMLIEQTRDLYSVDDSRVYVTGVSMGGFGALDYIDDYLDPSQTTPQFAAVAPLASGTGFLGDVSQLEPYRDTPIWLFHGDDDLTVDVSLSRDAFRSFTGLAPDEPIDFATNELGHPTAFSDNIRYSEIRGGSHSAWVRSIYEQPGFYDWLFSQALPVPEPGGLLTLVIGASLLAVTGRSPRE